MGRDLSRGVGMFRDGGERLCGDTHHIWDGNGEVSRMGKGQLQGEGCPLLCMGTSLCGERLGVGVLWTLCVYVFVCMCSTT